MARSRPAPGRDGSRSRASPPEGRALRRVHGTAEAPAWRRAAGAAARACAPDAALPTPLAPPPVRRIAHRECDVPSAGAPRLRTSLRRDAQEAGARRRSVGGRWYNLDVLLELRVENLLLIERAELRLGPGPERAHGRDGRGQDRARPRARPAARRARAAGIVRPGAAEAYVEGVSSCRRRCAASSASACPRTPRSSCSRGA